MKVVSTWHSLTPEQACEQLGVEVPLGLDAAEIVRRRAQVGPNKLVEAKKEPGWRAFLRQYRDLMQLVLLGAAIVSIVALQDSTGIVIFGVTLLNAILGLYQEGKAAESVAALQKMLVIKAHARRGGDLVDIPAEELVPGDIVSFEAGDKIPADGRLLLAATLEIEEAALTGESTPVGKSIDPVAGEAVPLGDRIDMAYMNSTVTRGRGEMVVTATGMTTEVGQISGMLGAVEQEKTSLTRQLDQLTILVALVAAAALVLVMVIGLIRGDSFYALFLIAISVAVAAIPTELPAVVTTMLSLGTQALAAKGRDRQAIALGRDPRRARNVVTIARGHRLQFLQGSRLFGKLFAIPDDRFRGRLGIEGQLLLLFVLDQSVHPVEGDAPVVADDAAAAVRVRQASQHVRTPAFADVRGVGVEHAVVVSSPVLGERFHDVRVRLVAVRFQRGQHHPEPPVGHDGALQRRLGLEPDDDFEVAVDVARRMRGDRARHL